MPRRPLAAAVDLSRLGAYRGLSEVASAFGALPGARVRIEGRSRQGREILGVELGDPAAPRVALVIAGLHALEWIGVETALAIAADFARSPAPDRRLVVLPVVNADGYARVEADLREGRRRFVRGNASGVDLNRNYPTHFRRVHLRSALLPFLGGPGAHPGSEPETQAVLSVLGREPQRIDRAVSLHSIGNKLLLPFGGRWAPPHDIARLRGLAEAVRGQLSDRYQVRIASHWTPGAFAYGMELDHLHAQGIEPILVECSRGGFSLLDPTSWLHPFRWYNPPEPARHARSLAAALRGFLAPG